MAEKSWQKIPSALSWEIAALAREIYACSATDPGEKIFPRSPKMSPSNSPQKCLRRTMTYNDRTVQHCCLSPSGHFSMDSWLSAGLSRREMWRGDGGCLRADSAPIHCMGCEASRTWRAICSFPAHADLSRTVPVRPQGARVQRQPPHPCQNGDQRLLPMAH